MNMKNFSIGDKVVLTKSFERYSKVGEVYEIGNIVVAAAENNEPVVVSSTVISAETDGSGAIVW